MHTISNHGFNPFGFAGIPYESLAEGLDKNALFDISEQARPYGFKAPLAISHLLRPLLEPHSSEYANNITLLLLATRRSTILARRADDTPKDTQIIRFRIPQFTLLELAFILDTGSDGVAYTRIGIASEFKTHSATR